LESFDVHNKSRLFFGNQSMRTARRRIVWKSCSRWKQKMLLAKMILSVAPIDKESRKGKKVCDYWIRLFFFHVNHDEGNDECLLISGGVLESAECKKIFFALSRFTEAVVQFLSWFQDREQHDATRERISIHVPHHSLKSHLFHSEDPDSERVIQKLDEGNESQGNMCLAFSDVFLFVACWWMLAWFSD
jgi:hypothetical protein